MEQLRCMLREMSGWVQLIFLGALFFIGLLLASVSLIILYRFFGIDTTSVVSLKSAEAIRIALLSQSVFLFIFPTLAWAYLFREKPFVALKINKVPQISFVVLSIILIITIQPLIGVVAYYNNQIVLPESLSFLETILRQKEASQNAITENLLGGEHTYYNLLLNLFFVAVIAGISEEFIFRGTIQQILRRTTNNTHWAIWITAFVFSAIHLQPYGFFARFLLGALLGYMFVWSGNLWIPILAHTINNALGVISKYMYNNLSPQQNTVNIPQINLLWGAIISIVVSGIVIYYMTNLHLKNKIEQGKV